MTWRAAVAAVLAAGLFWGDVAAACPVPEGLKALVAETLRVANSQRQAAGVAPLALHPALGRAAQRHACDMAARSRMGHDGTDGTSFDARVQREGYSFAMANENVGAGFGSPGAMVQGWMSSPGHRTNLLAPQSRDAGVGIARAKDGTLFWAMVTARTR